MHYYLAYSPEHFYTGHISTSELTHENKTIYRLILMTHTYTPIKNFFELPIPLVSNHELWVNLALIIQNKPVYSQINSAIRFFLAGYSLVVDSTCTSKVGASHSWLAASHSMYWKATLSSVPMPVEDYLSLLTKQQTDCCLYGCRSGLSITCIHITCT